EAFRTTSPPTPARGADRVVHAASLLLGSSNLRSHFRCEVDFLALDALAHLEAGEGYDLGAGFPGQITDLDFRILDEGLLDQAGLGQELVDPALDHVLDDVLRLAGDLVRVQRQEDFLLLLDHLGGNLGRVEQLRVAGSHMQDRKSTRLNSSHVKISYA